jgi:NADPH:quinone reductase-like Zn-dependent oxidoreductase
VAVDYREQDFVEEVVRATDGRGVDVVLDNMGAAYLSRNVAALATAGRIVVIGLQGGTQAQLDLGLLLSKRAAVIATSLRRRPTAEKSAICAAVVEHVWPLVADGRIRTMLHRTFALDEAGAAHALMESGRNTGKIALVVNPDAGSPS